MLGYVRAYKPEMKVADYEVYRGIYCSVCNALGKYYGVFGRLLLSYDFAFAAMVKLAAGSASCTFTQKRCPLNPAKKCFFCEDKREIDLCAHGAVIAVYYKLKDNIKDKEFGKRFLSLLALPAVSLMHKKAKRLAPEIETAISSAVAAQADAENDPESGIDACADPSADALGRLFSLESEEKESELYRLGYLTGRYVYILDAVDDYGKDVKTGAFNPFKKKYPDISEPGAREEFIKESRALLNQTHCAADEAREKAEFKRFDDIIDNVVFDGLSSAADKAVSKYLDCPEKPKSFTVK